MSKVRNGWRHFKTVTHHKLVVMGNGFRVGLYRQGLAHDLSKYSPTEFRVGVEFYQGDRSPNTEERRVRGYSTAWLHHKGRNKHHYEYWIDMVGNRDARFEGKSMPTRYVVEMFCDRVAASKVYQGPKYTDRSALEYFQLEQTAGELLMHEDTKRLLTRLLTLLADEGEEVAFKTIRRNIVKARYVEGPNGTF